jgi:hypothetical protein
VSEAGATMVRHTRPDVVDRISLTIPADERFRPVSTLVLGGVGTRLDLSFERMDDLQLALLSLLEAVDGEEATVEIVADDGTLAVKVGPLRAGTGGDAGLERVVSRLVDERDLETLDGSEWMTLSVVRPGAPASA